MKFWHQRQNKIVKKKWENKQCNPPTDINILDIARCSHFSCKKQAKQKRQLTQPAITINTERWIRHSEERCHPASQRATQGWQWQDKNVIHSPISKNNVVNIHWPTETSNLNTESCSRAHLSRSYVLGCTLQDTLSHFSIHQVQASMQSVKPTMH